MREKLQVLVLDDESIVCERLGSSLEKFGFAVETCTESQKAVRLISQRNFDVVVTDLKMTGLDGIEILKLVKEKSPRTQVIIITGDERQ